MRYKLLPATESLIARLYNRPGLWSRFVHSEQTEEIVRQIAKTCEPAAIPDLLAVLLTRERSCVAACAIAIHQLLREVPPAEFISLGEFVRSRSNWRPERASWYGMEAKDVKHLSDIGEARVSILGLASFHGNGRVREEALRTLASVRSGDELPFLFVRANDWVEPIRLMAREFILDRLQPEFAEHLLRWLPLILRLEKGSRGSHTWIIENIRKLFSRDELHATLMKGLEAEDRPTRRFCFDVAFGLGRERQRDAILRAFGDDDVQIRKAATNILPTILVEGGHRELLALAINDPVASIRQRTLQILERNLGLEAEKEFVTALVDPSDAVREQARAFLEKRASIDTRRYYVEHLRTENISTLSASIAGVGETGAAADCGLLEPFVTSPSARIRAAAIRALGKLNADEYRNQFLAALDDASTKVASEARLALSKQVNLVGASRLWECFATARHSHTKRLAIYLLARTSKWDSIAYLLQALSDDDERVVELSRRYLARWFVRYNRSFAAPSLVQLTRLKSVLGEQDLLVSDGIQRQLESMVKSFGGPRT